MPDSLTVDGLTVETASEITAGLTAGLQGIYGSDINVDQNSQDGQTIGIITQEAVDIREMLVQINTSFDPDQAVGALLDQRVAINNIQRIAGTYSIFPVDITTNATVTLAGLDTNFSSANGTGFTVTDGQGNNFILSNTVTLTAGTTTVDFRAQMIGNVDVPINTITTPVTIVAGVTAVNNSTAAITIGQVEETDPQLRLRRQRSVALTGTGYLNGLLGTLLALTGVTEAAVYENVGASTDSNGIPGHGIWAVVAGGSSADIANAIYQKKAAGTNMKGSISVPITTPSGVIFNALYDVPVSENLYIKFTVKRTTPGFAFNFGQIAAYMTANLSYGIGQFAETSNPTAVAIAAINSLGGGGVPVLMQISNDNINFTDYLDPSTLASQFTLSTANFTINAV